MADVEIALDALRQATRGTEYEGHLHLVGGYVRDRVMGLSSVKDDIDIVLESDAVALAEFFHACGIARYRPVVYPRFGTAMIVVEEGEEMRNVELVTARVESYAQDSRKPSDVQPGTLVDDARRRDFTINTLLQNLHTGEITDPLGTGFADIEARIVRTPANPHLTFQDDPLRMLRAVRFSARFDFKIEPGTWNALRESASRLAIISAERIRDELCKILMAERASLGLNLLRESGLLSQFAPELVAMVGVAQNEFHAYPVWEHTLVALDSLPRDSSLIVRLATLLHDIGKPSTRSVGDDGLVHFYGHQNSGAEMARSLLGRLKFSNDEIGAITRLVAEHMRIGEYKPSWTDAAVRRLMRDLGPQLDDFFTIHRADVAALGPEHRDISRASDLRARIDPIKESQDIDALKSPLDGLEIMRILNISAGREIGRIKNFLTNEVVEGRLPPEDKIGAAALARQFAQGEQATR